jgi:hypothetical protein
MHRSGESITGLNFSGLKPSPDRQPIIKELPFCYSINIKRKLFLATRFNSVTPKPTLDIKIAVLYNANAF